MAQSHLPETLPIVPLETKVLLPSVVLKITMRGREAVALTRKHFRSTDQSKPAHLACIPLKPLPALAKKDDTLNEEKAVVVSSKKDPDESDATGLLVKPSDKDRLYEYGCAARILRIQRAGLGAVSVFVEGVARVKVDRVFQSNNTMLAKLTYVERPTKDIKVDDELKDELIAFKALCREFLTKMKDLQLPDTLVQQLSKLVDNVSPVVLADMLVSVIETSFEEKLWMLSTTNVKERLTKASEWMTRQLHVSSFLFSFLLLLYNISLFCPSFTALCLMRHLFKFV